MPGASRRLALLVVLLLGVEFVDELYSGVPSLGAAHVQAEYGATYTVTALALLLVPGLVALIAEPLLFVLADRYPRKWFVCGGLFAMSGAAVLAASAPNIIVFSVALCIAYVGSGCGVALSQATLVDAQPDQRERALTRWALLGEIGDLMGPILMGLLATFSFGWRAAYLIVAGLTFVWGVLLLPRSFPGSEETNDPASIDSDDDEDEPGIVAALVEAGRNRRLLFWLGATALCDLMDEILVVFAVLFLRDELNAGPVERAIVIGAGVAGAIAGVLLTDRLLRRVKPLGLLFWSSVGCTIGYALWMGAPSVWLSTVAFFFVGVAAAPMYPIASAQAYACLPGRSGTVNAVGHVFTPITLALPWVLGALADQVSIWLSLSVLLIQPLGLGALSLHALRTRPSDDGRDDSVA